MEKAVDRQLRAGDECERTPRTVRARAAAGERLGLRVGEVEVVTRPDSCGACASSRERDLPKPTESNITAATATTLHRPAPNKPNPYFDRGCATETCIGLAGPQPRAR